MTPGLNHPRRPYSAGNRGRRPGPPGKSAKVSKSSGLVIRKLGIQHFILFSLILFLLPLAREWRSLAFGERVTGTVIENKKITTGEGALIGGVEYRAIIAYTHDNKEKLLTGPENLRYEQGTQLRLIIHPQKPDKVIIASIAGFYIHKRSIALIVVFVLWLAIYSTIVQGQTRRR